MCCNICTEDPIREPKINFPFPFYATFRPKIFLLPLLNNFDPILTWKTVDLTPVRKYHEQVNMKCPFALPFIANMSLFSCFKRLNGMLHENDLHREFESSMMLVIPSEFKSLVQCCAHKQSAVARGRLQVAERAGIKNATEDHGDKIILNKQPTEHLADVGLDVDVLEVVESVGVVEAERGVQPDGDPHPVTHPGHLPHLGLLPATRAQLEM